MCCQSLLCLLLRFGFHLPKACGRMGRRPSCAAGLVRSGKFISHDMENSNSHFSVLHLSFPWLDSLRDPLPSCITYLMPDQGSGMKETILDLGFDGEMGVKWKCGRSSKQASKRIFIVECAIHLKENLYDKFFSKPSSFAANLPFLSEDFWHFPPSNSSPS